MAGNPNFTDILTTTIENRSKKLRDQITKNNALLMKMTKKGNVRTFSGGTKIVEEMMYSENVNASWYSGYDLLPTAHGDTLTAAEYDIKQAAVPVVISGLDQLKNAGKEKMIELMESRLRVAEITMKNLLALGIYSDGSASSGKQVDGLEKGLPAGSSTGRLATGSYGGISRSEAFWRPFYQKDATLDATTILASMNALWVQLVRGSDRPDLILTDGTTWATYVAVLQDLMRFTNPSTAEMGFPSVKFMDADVVLDGGIGGYAGDPDGDGTAVQTMYFLNTDYFHWRPHSQRNIVPLSPNKRYATNQDAEVQIIAWAGNLTCSGQLFQGRLGKT